MATVSIKLDQRRKLQDDTFPIVLSISHKGVTATIQTGLSVTTENWKNSKLIANSASDHCPLKAILHLYQDILEQFSV